MKQLENNGAGNRANGPCPKIAAPLLSTAPFAYPFPGTDTTTVAKSNKRRGKKWGIVTATGPRGDLAATGQTGKALVALVKAGGQGVTALEVNSWGAYVHLLRRDHGLAIETLREPHDGGWHGRYVLRSPVTLTGALS